MKRAWTEALKARAGAYAPYSRYRVGAALLGPRGRRWTGCNVENSSFGGTICAERTAFLKAVSEGVRSGFTDLVVVVAGSPVNPCGLCLQVISEFAPSDLRIWSGTPDGIFACRTLDELMPVRFTKRELDRNPERRSK